MRLRSVTRTRQEPTTLGGVLESSPIVVGPLFAAALLLGGAGAAKVARPGSAERALRTAGLPAPGGSGRLLGLVEVTIAVGVLVIGGPVPAALLGLSYAGFAAFSHRLRARGGSGASCGCFGETRRPVTGVHLALNGVVAALAVAAVAWPVPAVAEVVADQPLAGLPLVALVALATWLAYLALTLLPTVAEAAKGPAGGPTLDRAALARSGWTPIDVGGQPERAGAGR